MKRKIRILTALALALSLVTCAALADTLSMSGTVTASGTVEIYAPIGGTIESLLVSAGDTVAAGDVIAHLKTEKVYAPESGTVTGVFAQAGDNAETVGSSFGAVMYIEGASVYTISASTDDSYNATANKLVHVGEQVVLRATSSDSRTGKGVITGAEGTDFTVRVTSGAFLVGEKVAVFRRSAAASNRLGKGTLTRTAPTAVTGTGSIVSLAVEDGDKVEKGDLLFETLKGDFDGLYATGTDICANAAGVISEVRASQGDSIEKGSVVAVLYPAGGMEITAEVAEEDLAFVRVGDAVEVELIWNQDENKIYPGAIKAISSVANAKETTQGESTEDTSVTFNVIIGFTPDEDTRYGMSAVITTLESEGEKEEEHAEEEMIEEDAYEVEMPSREGEHS